MSGIAARHPVNGSQDEFEDEFDELPGLDLGLGAAIRSIADPEALRATPALLREPAWWGGLLVVVALSVSFVFLGRWQLHRYEAKVVRKDLVAANYNAAPVPLDRVLPSTATPLAAAAQWKPVRLQGRYDTGHALLARNRPLDERTGYEQLVPLRLDGGGVLVIDRGWVPAGRTGADPDTVPSSPTGPVSVVGRLRPGEPAVDRTAPGGQIQRIDLAAVSRLIGEPVFQAYAVLAQETPPAASAPTPLLSPDVDLGPHLPYAVQWWGFTLTAYLVWLALAVREAQRRIATRRPPACDPSPAQ